MLKYARPTLLTASLWAALAAIPASAQTTPKKPAAKTDKPTTTTTKAAPGATTGVKATAGDNEVVGSVNNKQITWGQLIARIHKDSPQLLTSALAQAVGTKAADAFFGPTPKTSFTVTYDEAMASLRKSPPPQMRQVLQSLLIEDALDQEAARLNVQPTDAQINARITQLLADARKQKVIPDNMTDDAFLASRHRTRADVARSLRPQMRIFALIEKEMEKPLGHPLGPDDFYQARHILIRVPESDPNAKEEDKKKADADALAKITKIADDIKAGKVTFEQAAKDNSEDGSKGQGGDLGVAFRLTMVEPFSAAVYKLKPGEVSPPVRSEFGYHLIRLEKAGKDIPADERQKALEQYEQNQVQTYLNTLTTQRIKIVNNLPASPQVGMQPGMVQPSGGR